jgi:hypothetical protein
MMVYPPLSAEGKTRTHHCNSESTRLRLHYTPCTRQSTLLRLHWAKSSPSYAPHLRLHRRSSSLRRPLSMFPRRSHWLVPLCQLSSKTEIPITRSLHRAIEILHSKRCRPSFRTAPHCEDYDQMDQLLTLRMSTLTLNHPWSRGIVAVKIISPAITGTVVNLTYTMAKVTRASKSHGSTTTLMGHMKGNRTSFKS